MDTIDARGLSCPQPVILLKKKLAEAPGGCKILLDNPTAVENCTRFAEHLGMTVVTSPQSGGEFCLAVGSKS